MIRSNKSWADQMRHFITKSSLAYPVLIFFIIVLLNGKTAFAITKEKQFVPEDIYKFLFSVGLRIVRSNITGVIMGSKGYTSQPRLKSTSRPRSVEYTTFSFDGYWERRPWERTALAGRYWEKFHMEDREKDRVPGTWYFKVRWTTRAQHSQQHGFLTILEFEEVMPDIFFIRYGANQERKDFSIQKRFPDKDHKVRGYANGKFGKFKRTGRSYRE